MRAVDLHTHSNKSDGSYSPSELIAYAAQKNLAAIALTDHDTVAGLDEAIAAGHELGIEVIPGVELSCEYKSRDIHIVGLGVDYKNSSFVQKLNEFVDTREIRNRKMCSNLTNAGMDVNYDCLIEKYGESVITRAHFAQYMLEKGYITSLKEAFERYIGDTCPYYVPREKITPVQAVEFILEGNGIPVLAHPVLYHMSNANLRILVEELKLHGLMGIEAIYSTYSSADERDIRRIAKDFDLKISGGSDFHGTAKPGLDLGTGYGHLFVPEEVWENLKK